MKSKRRPRRVLMTGDAVGGVWDYTMELAQGLCQSGVEVVLAIMGPGPRPHQRRFAQSIAGLTLLERPFSLEWMEDPWHDVDAAGEWLLELEFCYGCDLVHLNGFVHGEFPFRSPKLVVGHSCVLSWWFFVKGEEAPPSWDLYRQRVTAGLRAADRVVAPTRWMLSVLRTFYGPLPTGRVIPNGRTADRFPPGDKLPFVFSAGRIWDPAKNIEQLLKVANGIDVPIRVAGSARLDSADGATDQFPEEDARRSWEFLGPLSSEELAQQYARAAIYALPARYEPFGLTVLEAALAGCALVLGDIPSLRELWHGAALFVDPNDEAGLATALRGLLNSPETCAAFGQEARRRALRYSAARMVERYLDTYGQLLTMNQISSPEAAEEVNRSCVL